MNQLNESGIVSHDLDFLVLPMIEIDTFESKIDNSKVIVVAFYVFEQEPAKDLELFIEKGEVECMDTETSPAPTEDGYYVVFVELDRDFNFPEKVVNILDSIDNLTNVEQWQFKTYHDDNIYDLSLDTLKEHVNLDPSAVPPSSQDIEDEAEEEEVEELPSEEEPEETPEEEPVAESVKRILSNGLFESIELNSDILKINDFGKTLHYKIVQYSNNELSVPISGLEIGNPLIRESLTLSRTLGPAYIVEAIDAGLLISGCNGYLVIEPID